MTDRTRFARACAIGGALATLAFGWLVAAGQADLLRPQWFGDFYDAQAHSLLDGRWDVPPEVLRVEAFVIDDRSYMYFGPTPALLRLPVAAVTDRLDGRLTQLSLLAAYVVALVAASRLHWRIRRLVRGNRRLSRMEALGVGAWTFLLGTGSALLYLGSRAYVYHEALAWGVALSLAAFEALLGWVERPSRGLLALSTVLASLALLSRASVGAGPVAVLGLLALAAAVRRRWSVAIGAGLAAGVPVALYAAVNQVKFGSLLSVPFDAQVITRITPARQALLAENDGSLFGLRYVPTSLFQYLRPDRLAVDGLFPWLTFPGPATVLLDATPDALDYASSVPATMPLLTVLSIVGAVAVARGGALRPLRALALGAAAATVTTLSISYVAHRYVADALPLLVLLGLAGLQVVLARLDGRRRRAQRAVVAGLLVLGLFGVAANGALALVYQRLYSPTIEDDVRAGFVGFQHDVTGAEPDLRRGDDLPDPGPDGRLFVIGDCIGLYRSDGGGWSAVERTAAVGYHRLRVTFDGDRQVLVRTSGGVIALDGLEGTHDVDVIADRRLGFLTVLVDRRRVVEELFSAADDDYDLGPGVDVRPFEPAVCEGLVG